MTFRLSIAVFLVLSSMISSSQSLSWGKRITGSGFEEVCDIAVDTSGNLYTIGFFNYTADFDPSNSIYNLTSYAGGSDYAWHGADVFVTKWDEHGMVIWAKNFSSQTYESKGLEIAIDAAGMVYCTGYFNKEVDFDPGSGTFNLNAGNNKNGFLAKLDKDGNFIWAKQFGDSSCTSTGSGLQVDKTGNVIMRGTFAGTMNLGSNTSSSIITSQGGQTFICKYSNNGTLIWSKQFHVGMYEEVAGDVELDALDHVYFTSSFSGLIDMDPSSGVYNLKSDSGSSNACIVKLDHNGNLVWAKTFSGQGTLGLALTVDISGNIICAGRFGGVCDFDPNSGTYTISATSANDSYITKLSPNGGFIWAKSIHASYLSTILALTTDAGGNIYAGGWFKDTIDCDPGPSKQNIITSALSAGFVTCWNTSGSYIWGGSLYPTTKWWDVVFTNAFAADLHNNVYFGGWFSGPTDVDPFSTSIIFSPTNYDAFICKVKTCDLPTPLTANPVGPSMICKGDAAVVTYSTDPNVVWFNSGFAIGSGTVCTTPGLTAGTNTIYVRPENTCGINPKSSQLVITLTECVAVLESALENTLKIYPNPSNGSFRVDADERIIGKEYTIIDMSGRIILQGIFQMEKNKIDIEISPGLYILRTSNGLTTKFTKI